MNTKQRVAGLLAGTTLCLGTGVLIASHMQEPRPIVPVGGSTYEQSLREATYVNSVAACDALFGPDGEGAFMREHMKTMPELQEEMATTYADGYVLEPGVGHLGDVAFSGCMQGIGDALAR